MTPHDGTAIMAASTEIERPSTTQLRKIAKEIDFSKVLKWHDLDSLDVFWALVEKPPVHSVVIDVAPVVMAKLLELTNTSNRPMSKGASNDISVALRESNYELTGDTVKFSSRGTMLDGQHRFKGAVDAKKHLITHVVFGLAEDIFDVLDRGKKRTAGDVLALVGVENHLTVAGAVRQASMYLEGLPKTGGARGHTPRRIRQLATGEMVEIKDYVKDARMIASAFPQLRHPPSMLTAILYMIGKQSKAMAKSFAHEWVHGARVGRGENFDVLTRRLLQVQSHSGGAINSNVRAALIIQAFNHWHAGVVAEARALTWRRDWAFPVLEFNKAAFLKKREQSAKTDSSLPASQLRVLAVINKAADKRGNAELPGPEISRRAGLPPNQVGDVVRSMIDGNLIHLVRKGGKFGPSIYRLKDAGKARLAGPPA